MAAHYPMILIDEIITQNELGKLACDCHILHIYALLEISFSGITIILRKYVFIPMP